MTLHSWCFVPPFSLWFGRALLQKSIQSQNNGQVWLILDGIPNSNVKAQIEDEDMAVMNLIMSAHWVVMMDENGLDIDSEEWLIWSVMPEVRYE